MGGREVPVLGWLNSMSIYGAFETLSKGKSLIITSAGNYAPDHKLVEGLKIKASEELNLLIVGSSTPNGFVSDYSQKAGKVAISAPSNSELSEQFE